MGENVQRIILRRRLYITTWIAASFMIATYSNSCGKVGFAQLASNAPVDAKSAGVILINKDAPYTNSQLVEINLESKYAKEVYITNSPDCASGGKWEPFVTTHPWTLEGVNRQIPVFAKFKNDEEKSESVCLSDSIVHDNQKPLVVLEQPNLITNSAVPLARFVASDAISGIDKMYCQWPGQSAQECNSAASNGNLTEGQYLVKISATDRAGNSSDVQTQDIVVDRTAPVLQFLNRPPSVGNNPAVTYTFNANDDRSGIKSVECAFDNKANYAACTSPINSTQTEGAHSFYVRVRDVAGNESEVSHNFSIDLSAPTVTITASPPDFSSSQSGQFSFSGNDGAVSINTFKCRLDGSTLSDCTSPKNYSNLTDGVHNFEVVGVDGVGNPSSPATRSWYVDTGAPTITFIAEPPALSSASSATYRYTVADSGSGILRTQCQFDSAPYVDCSNSIMTYADLSNGSHTFKLKAIDKAGNTTESPLKSFIVDLTPPQIQFLTFPSGFTIQPAAAFTFNATDANGIDRVECRLDATSFGACTSSSAHNVSGLIEGSHSLTIRSVDRAGNFSPEISKTWTVDLTRPTISYFQLPPSSALYNTSVSLGFTVADNLSGIASLACTLDGVPTPSGPPTPGGSTTPCTPGQLITLNLATGVHTYVVTVTDGAGNTATDTRSITMSPPVLHTQLADVKLNPKVDILVIMDNSGSMAGEMTNMSQRIGNLLSNISTLDWQIGIITTDVSANVALRDGRLIPLTVPAGTTYPTGQYILRSSDNPAAAQAVFAASVQMPTNGSGSEWGLKAAIRAIDRAFDLSTQVNLPNSQLFRNDAALAMLVVSDSMDDSGTTPENVINRVNVAWPNNKRFTFHSIVVPQSSFTNPNANNVDPADPCAVDRESVKYDGRIYERLSDLTGGIKGTVCAVDYGGQLTAMGRATTDLVNSVTLECAPIDNNSDGVVNSSDIQVTSVNGPLTASDFTLTGSKLTFSSSLPVGSNSIEYYCVQ